MDRKEQWGKTIRVAPGIAIRQWKNTTTMRLSFCYRGVSCRETIKLPATEPHLRYVKRLRGEILNAIALGTFDYGHYFPLSKRARLFGHINANPRIGDLLSEFLGHAERTLQRSTVIGYRKVCQAHLFKVFGKIPVRDLSPAFIRSWIAKLNLTTKAVRNILIPLRAVLNEAVNDDIILRNPLDRVILTKLLNKQTCRSSYVADPFSRQEIHQLLAHSEGQVRNLIQFAFFTGLRPSELIGLRWEDIDWTKGVVHVRRAVVSKQEKCTKTPAGQREVLLLPPALDALLAQKSYTFLEGDRVFHHPTLKKAWISDTQIRKPHWIGIFKRSGVRYRNFYQTRHTFASMLLSAGENMLWLSKQMGHRDAEMLIKVYTKWIPQPNSDVGYQPTYNWKQALVPVNSPL